MTKNKTKYYIVCFKDRNKYGFSSDAPILSWNDRENALKMNCNLTARGIKAYKHYLTRFINYIKAYGYMPKYTIAEV